MPAKQRILVLRFSAMGDVAMTAPVLRQLAEQHPETELVVVSRALFEPFFEAIPNLKFHAFHPKGKHQGFKGLLKLFAELQTYEITALADLHQNLRSRILSTLFRLKGLKTATVNKGRGDKKTLTRKDQKILRPLRPMVERYADVFRKLGFPIQLQNKLNRNPETLSPNIKALTGDKGDKKWIGISPFAQHAQKVYPLEKMGRVIAGLAAQNLQLFIFGGGPEEQAIAESWAHQNPNTISLVGKLKLRNELMLISNLDLMLSMDSAGMHLASLKGIPVVSVWGATHPYAGFLGYGQSAEHCVQLDLYCRPCSVYGNKPCYRGDFACMQQLSEEIVIQKIINTIS
ncbi:MAG: glycosyltransferase family 9 protein [Sphingobacteriaceae bacterium]